MFIKIVAQKICAPNLFTFYFMHTFLMILSLKKCVLKKIREKEFWDKKSFFVLGSKDPEIKKFS